MKKSIITLLLTASLSHISYAQSEQLKLSSSRENVLYRPDLKPIKGIIVFEKGIEQYGIKIDSNYYFVRYRFLVPVKKKVKGFKQLLK